MIKAFVLLEAEPGRVRELVRELPTVALASSVVSEAHAVTGRFNLMAVVHSPDIDSLMD